MAGYDLTDKDWVVPLFFLQVMIIQQIALLIILQNFLRYPPFVGQKITLVKVYFSTFGWCKFTQAFDLKKRYLFIFVIALMFSVSAGKFCEGVAGAGFPCINASFFLIIPVSPPCHAAISFA